MNGDGRRGERRGTKMRIGQRCEILPAFNSDTGERDIIDDITFCEVFVMAIRTGGDVDVETRNGTETTIHIGRLRAL
jgi:hypothetical protein